MEPTLRRPTTRSVAVVALVALVAAFAMLLGGFAWGSIPSSNGVISACYKSGSLRLIDAEAGAKCTKDERLMTWNQQGPPGPSSLSVVLRQSSRELTLAPGEGDWVASQCAAGEVVVGGGVTNTSPSASVGSSGPFFDGVNPSGWTVRFDNESNETLTFFPTVGAECVPGSMSTG